MDDIAVLTEATAAAYIGAAAFRIGPPGRVGVELEYPVRDPAYPLDRPSIARLHAAVAHLGDPLPGGGRITVEPGGQVELASSVGATGQDCIDAPATDLALLRAAFAAEGLRLEGTGLDTSRTPRLVAAHPRYVALAAYHDRVGPKSRAVMCNSASVQVCLDAGDDSDGWTGYRHRWWLADAIGPVLLASFANSPHRSRSGIRWVSRRQALRFGTDPSRTRAPRHTAEPRTARRHHRDERFGLRRAPVARRRTAGRAAPPGASDRRPHRYAAVRGGGATDPADPRLGADLHHRVLNLVYAPAPSPGDVGYDDVKVHLAQPAP